jgi:hypothetical protein
VVGRCRRRRQARIFLPRALSRGVRCRDGAFLRSRCRARTGHHVDRRRRQGVGARRCRDDFVARKADRRAMCAAEPLRGRSREQGEAEARSARLRAWTTADARAWPMSSSCKEAARNSTPAGGSEAAKPQAWGER